MNKKRKFDYMTSSCILRDIGPWLLTGKNVCMTLLSHIPISAYLRRVLCQLLLSTSMTFWYKYHSNSLRKELKLPVCFIFSGESFFSTRVIHVIALYTSAENAHPRIFSKDRHINAHKSLPDKNSVSVPMQSDYLFFHFACENPASIYSYYPKKYSRNGLCNYCYHELINNMSHTYDAKLIGRNQDVTQVKEVHFHSIQSANQVGFKLQGQEFQVALSNTDSITLRKAQWKCS
ncbi:hypothetical protein EGR_04303 [Echinococcus granulosus]|uniref:Uncharacterized protein n=1 Tax=Echinococcus granulosus TaxID=6210 RepID=W6V448_ECHGR|nr:hypothetical protein EGR_04303 [Echinococcus granulosus]EUB60864.1 hypothetical protein EGR_04303 [Echinococcus granulosus]